MAATFNSRADCEATEAEIAAARGRLRRDERHRLAGENAGAAASHEAARCGAAAAEGGLPLASYRHSRVRFRIS
jgi:hypothetical protein